MDSKSIVSLSAQAHGILRSTPGVHPNVYTHVAPTPCMMHHYSGDPATNALYGDSVLKVFGGISVLETLDLTLHLPDAGDDILI